MEVVSNGMRLRKRSNTVVDSWKIGTFTKREDILVNIML